MNSNEASPLNCISKQPVPNRYSGQASDITQLGKKIFLFPAPLDLPGKVPAPSWLNYSKN